MNVRPRRFGKRVDVRDSDALRQQAHNGQLSSSTPGVDIVESPGGTTFDFDLPVAMWVFVTSIASNGMLIVRRAKRTKSGKWRLDNTTSAFAVPPAPNYTTAHFRYFIIEASQPTKEELVCRLFDGTVEPNFRFMLTQPVIIIPPSSSPGPDSAPSSSGGCVGCDDDG